MKVISVLTLFIFLLFGCNTTKKTAALMDSWIGNTKQALIKSWGPPERTSSDGADGEVLVYAYSSYNSYNHYTMYDYRMFYAHADGKIYHWKTNSSATPPQQIDVYLR